MYAFESHTHPELLRCDSGLQDVQAVLVLVVHVLQVIWQDEQLAAVEAG